MISKAVAPVDDDLSMSPEMAALTRMQRAFIDCLFAKAGDGKLLSKAACARAAGYSPNGDAHAHNAQAQKLLADPRIQGALQAETRRRLRTMGPEAVQAIDQIMTDPHHKDRLKAANLIIERVDPQTTRLEATVTHEVNHHLDALNELRALKALGVSQAKLEELYGYTGLQKLERALTEGDKASAITVDYTEVEPAPAEDWENG
jgi:phage terminase small subunit